MSAVSGSQWSPENTAAKYTQEKWKVLEHVMSGLKGPVWCVLMEMEATWAKTQEAKLQDGPGAGGGRQGQMTLGC